MENLLQFRYYAFSFESRFLRETLLKLDDTLNFHYLRKQIESGQCLDNASSLLDGEKQFLQLEMSQIILRKHC